MKPGILISRVLPESALALASQRAAVDLHREAHPLPKAEPIARLKDKEGLVCLIKDRIDGEVLAVAPRLRVVANVAVGYDNIAGLLQLPNVVLAPHVASASVETQLRMATLAVENCLSVLEGTPPLTPVNPEVLTS